MTKFYEYKACSSCEKAAKFLESMGVVVERLPIVDQPPSMTELTKMLGYLKGDGATFKNLFNISGQVYRELGVSEKIKAGMTETEALALLAKNGKLIKRPFLIAANAGTVGFKEDVWKKLLPHLK